MSCNATNIKIDPADVSWQIEEKWCVETVADVASSLNSKYFRLGVSGQSTFSHYVWIDVGNTGTDPAIAGLTGVEVNISANATANTVASAINTAVDALAGFESTVSGNEITITMVGAGDSAGLLEGVAATGFTFTQQAEGGDLDLGYLDGDIEVSFEENLFEVTAHQTGVSKLADLRQGVSAEVSLVLKESNKSRFDEIFKAAGGTYTPSGGTELVGWGTNRQGSNTIVQARRLVLHPVRLASADYSEDLCFWKAYPMPESVVFSGENPKVMNITFKMYLDENQDEAIKLFSFGDWTQELPA